MKGRREGKLRENGRKLKEGKGREGKWRGK